MNGLLVGLGGCIGSVLRYLLGGMIQSRVTSGFPLGTLIVNVIGCLAIGAMSELVETRGTLGGNGQAFLMVGILGGFTTMSAFANDTVAAMRGGAWGVAGWNLVTTVGLTVGAVYAGRTIVAWAGR
jgi:CrcB protein